MDILQNRDYVIKDYMIVVELEQMLDDYYEERGWDKETGNPKRPKLESLGLKSVADELEKMDKLPS